MRYIVYGAGAVGGALGGLLCAAGLEAVLICRGAQLSAVQSQGLRILTPAGTVNAPVVAVGHPSDLRFRNDDIVILTMKSQDTERALLDLEAAGGGDLPIVCCQNGVENERLAARRFERVYGMVVAMPANYLQPGSVTVFGVPAFGVLDCGRYPTGVDPLITRVAADITRAGYNSRAIPAIMRLKYSKLLDNLSNGLLTLTAVPRGDPEIRRLIAALCNEAIACFEAAGIDYASRPEYAEEVSSRYSVAAVPGDKRAGNSTWQGLVRGRPTVEVDHLNGEIVLLGALHGVPTPYNAAIRSLTQQMANRGETPQSYSLDQVIAALDPAPATS